MTNTSGERHPTRFRKGHSGNPKGRPKRQKTGRPSAFDIVIDRTLTIMQNGRPREVTVDEALQHKTYLEALTGSRPARREILRMIAKREKALEVKPQRRESSNLWNFVTEGEDPRNVDEALLILGIACLDPTSRKPESAHPPDLLLETWAVKVALSRRAARRLTKLKIDGARECTRNGDALNWPEPFER